jgi:hypothetical protein
VAGSPRGKVRCAAVAALTVIVGGCGAHESGAADAAAKSRVPLHYAGSAFRQDCAVAGIEPDGKVQFLAGCPLRAASPDGRWTLVQTGSEGPEGYRVYLEDSEGRMVGDVPGLADGMPFVLVWSPRPGWFAVSHHSGSFMDVPEVFEITASGVIERDQFARVAEVEAHRRYPCMPSGESLPWIWLNGVLYGWSRDGSRIAWAFTTRTDICLPDGHTGAVRPEWDWQPFLMISDVRTGAIVPGSVRVLEGNDPFGKLPTDGPYAAF